MQGSILVNAAGRYTTECKFCHRTVEHPPLEIPAAGDPGKRAAELTRKLLEHLQKRHPKEYQEGTALLAELPAFLILHAFAYDDPTMNARLETIRASIFQIVRKNGVNDSSIDYLVAGFGLDPEDAVKVTAALRSVRDACCEFGQFAPPPASPLITR